MLGSSVEDRTTSLPWSLPGEGGVHGKELQQLLDHWKTKLLYRDLLLPTSSTTTVFLFNPIFLALDFN